MPRTVDEYAVAGLTPEPSRLVAPPRVAESPVALECRLHAEIAMGDYFLVIGEVLAWAIDDAVLDAGPRLHPLIQRMRPMSRLGRKEWGGTLGEVRELDRPVWSEFGADRAESGGETPDGRCRCRCQAGGMNLILRILATAIATGVTAWLLPGIHILGNTTADKASSWWSSRWCSAW